LLTFIGNDWPSVRRSHRHIRESPGRRQAGRVFYCGISPRASMALNRQMLFQQRDRQAIFLRETSRALPDPKGRCWVTSRPAGGSGCQRRIRNRSIIRDLTTRREHQPPLSKRLQTPLHRGAFSNASASVFLGSMDVSAVGGATASFMKRLSKSLARCSPSRSGASKKRANC
jgi:hypothetical protein